jgi:gustatory receptor
VDKPTQKEVEMFLIAIDKNSTTISLDGYANINRELITSVSVPYIRTNGVGNAIYYILQNISFMATYLVVLMQFKLTLLRQNAKQAQLEVVKNGQY